METLIFRDITFKIQIYTNPLIRNHPFIAIKHTLYRFLITTFCLVYLSNLFTKEMVNILNISAEGVKKARYR